MATSTTTSSSKPRIRLGSKPCTYHVESKTRPGIFHVADAYRLTCTCEAGRVRRGCWHLRLALAYHDWRTRQVARPSAPTSTRSTGIAALQDAVA
jgi:hypothetical protein